MLDELGRSHRIATARYVGDVPGRHAHGSSGRGRSASGSSRRSAPATTCSRPARADVVPGRGRVRRRLPGVAVTAHPDGARPRRRRRRRPVTALDAAWPGWAAGVELVVAADGGARHATALGLRVHAGSATATRSTPGDLDSPGRGRRPDPARRAGQGRVGRRAGAPGRDRGGRGRGDHPRGARRRAPRPRAGERRPARSPGAGRPPEPGCTTSGRPGSRCSWRRTRTGRPVSPRARRTRRGSRLAGARSAPRQRA